MRKKSYLFIILGLCLNSMIAKAISIDSLKIKAMQSSDTAKYLFYVDISKKFRQINPDSSVVYAKKALALSYLENNEKKILMCLNAIGIAYDIQAKADSSLLAFKQMATLANKLKNTLREASAYNSIGKIFQNKGIYDSAVVYYDKARRMSEKIKPIELYILTSNNLGVVFKKLRLYDKAMKCFTEAELMAISNNLDAPLALIYNNISGVYKENGKDDLSLLYLQKSIEIDKKLENYINLVRAYSNMAEIYFDLNNVSEAQKNVDLAYNLATKFKTVSELSNLMHKMGTIAMKNKNYKLATGYFEKALKSMYEKSELNSIIPYMLSLSEAYYYDNQFKSASDTLFKLHEINRTLFSDKITNQISEIETKYQTEKKEQQIKLLNAERLAQENKIQKEILQKRSYIAGLILVVIMLMLAIRLYVIKKRSNEILSKQKIEILEKNSILTQQKEEITAQRDEIEVQNNQLIEANKIIEQKNKNITDSIKYALRIQSAILPPQELINHLVPNTFVLYKPKSIVSGDFYYLDSKENFIYFAAVDCTGHGVPGAFMSIVGYNLLNQALNEKNISEPDLMLNYLSEAVSKTLRQQDEDSNVRDGMDIVLCKLDRSNLKLKVASVHNSMYLVRNSELIEFKGEKWPIGKPFGVRFAKYSQQEFQLMQNDILYLFSDGFIDQFNGETRKKFTSTRFKELILQISNLPIDTQQTKLTETFENWKGNIEQIDDVMVLGIKI